MDIIGILYIITLFVLLIFFLYVGIVPGSTSAADSNSVLNSDYQTLLTKYQNYGQLINIDDNNDYKLYEIGPGSLLPNGLIEPISISYFPDKFLNGYIGYSNPPSCFYSDQTIAKKTRQICIGDSGCYPNYKKGDFVQFYETDFVHHGPCKENGADFGIISLGGFVGTKSQCLSVSPNENVGLTNCNPTDPSQIWSVTKDSSGYFGQITYRPFIQGNTGCLVPITSGIAGSSLQLYSDPTICSKNNWAFSPAESFAYQDGNGDNGGNAITNQKLATIPPQFIFTGPNFDQSSGLTDLKNQIPKYFSLSTKNNLTMQGFYIPNSQNPNDNSQKAAFIDYDLYNFIVQNPNYFDF